MWEERERSPALAAPGSNDFGGLIASSTTKEDGANDDELQVKPTIFARGIAHSLLR